MKRVIVITTITSVITMAVVIPQLIMMIMI